MREYETPDLVEVGTFESLTNAASQGNTLDSTFPNGTPTTQLTFSD